MGILTPSLVVLNIRSDLLAKNSSKLPNLLHPLSPHILLDQIVPNGQEKSPPKLAHCTDMSRCPAPLSSSCPSISLSAPTLCANDFGQHLPCCSPYRRCILHDVLLLGCQAKSSGVDKNLIPL